MSVNERFSLYRREHHKEAMVWQERGRQAEPQDEDEDRQTDNELHQHVAMVSGTVTPVIATTPEQTATMFSRH